jgi:hypothetical protein
MRAKSASGSSNRKRRALGRYAAGGTDADLEHVEQADVHGESWKKLRVLCHKAALNPPPGTSLNSSTGAAFQAQAARMPVVAGSAGSALAEFLR